MSGKYSRGGNVMANYMLEITMEARRGERHKYIKRSFPAKKGALDIGKYGSPYSKYGTVEIGELSSGPSAGSLIDASLKVKFDGEEITVDLNSFTTAKRSHSHIDPYMKTPLADAGEIVHTTFYLYIE